MIKAYYDENNSFVICASDDGNVYIWKKETNYTNNKIHKNQSHISFRPFDDTSSTCSFFLNESDYMHYQKKLLNVGVFIRNVILSVSKSGKIQVLVNPLLID